MTLEELEQRKRRIAKALDVSGSKRLIRDLGYSGPLADDVLLVALHKTRYQDDEMPTELRHESAYWLRERGHGGPFGPLLPEGELP